MDCAWANEANARSVVSRTPLVAALSKALVDPDQAHRQTGTHKARAPGIRNFIDLDAKSRCSSAAAGYMEQRNDGLALRTCSDLK